MLSSFNNAMTKFLVLLVASSSSDGLPAHIQLDNYYYPSKINAKYGTPLLVILHTAAVCNISGQVLIFTARDASIYSPLHSKLLPYKSHSLVPCCTHLLPFCLSVYYSCQSCSGSCKPDLRCRLSKAHI
jgi:hypothetical protein